MNDCSSEMEWFMKTLRDEFNVRIAAGDVAVEASELGVDEVEEIFVPREVMKLFRSSPKTD